MRINRREFLKGLTLLPLVAIPKLNIDSFIEDLDNFTDEQLRNLTEVTNLEVVSFDNPYICEPRQEYRATVKGGYVRYFDDADDVREVYGNIFAYYNVNDDIHFTGPREGWLL